MTQRDVLDAIGLSHLVPLMERVVARLEEADRLEAENTRFKEALAYVLEDYRSADLHSSSSYWPDTVLKTCIELRPMLLWDTHAENRVLNKCSGCGGTGKEGCCNADTCECCGGTGQYND